MNSGHKQTFLLVFLMLIGSAGAWSAGPPQQENTFYTTRTPRISLTNVNGTVIIRGWDRPQVYAVYLLGSPRIEIDTEQVPSQGEADKIQLATHILDRTLQGASAQVNYTLSVPLGSSVEIRNPQGMVRIDNLSGDAWVQSIGGDIVVTGASGQVSAHTLGGQIEIDHVSGTVDASSVTGNLRFISPSSTQIRASTTSGQIYYEGSLLPSADYTMQTFDGTINILCPRSSSFELNAMCVHCKVYNQLKLSRWNHAASGPSYGNSLFGMHNEGRATLELTSFKGGIHISPEPAPSGQPAP
ncbi:MAG: DUF4097 family beta strand repeat-containing protein [Terriglobia bacterium]